MSVPRPEPSVTFSSGLSEECVSFNSNGLLLRGVLSRPAGAPSSALVTVHGWASTRGGPSALLLNLCRSAAAAGSAALRFDLPGRGESDGAYGEADLDAMIDATSSAAALVKERTGGLPVYLCGICSGANVALAAAALGPQPVAGALALSPLPYQEHRGASSRLRRSWGNIKTYAKKALRLSTWKRLFKGEVDLAGVGKAVSAADAALKNGRNLKRSTRNIPAALSGYEGRVSLVWGALDPEAPAAEKYFKHLLRHLPVPPEITYVDGANHNFYGIRWHHDISALLCRLAERSAGARIRNTEEK